jgi:Zn-dependent M16 (insulinase) family peptidase
MAKKKNEEEKKKLNMVKMKLSNTHANKIRVLVREIQQAQKKAEHCNIAQHYRLLGHINSLRATLAFHKGSSVGSLN